MKELRSTTYDLKIWAGDQLSRNFSMIRDHLSTNEHYSLSKTLAMEFFIQLEIKEEDLSPEFKNYLMDFEFAWKRGFFEKVKKLNLGEVS